MSLPTDPERGANGNCWCRATQQTKYLHVRSQVGWFMGHWVPKMRGSCRCLGELCPICAAGSEPRPFYYIAVCEEGNEIKFLEIPRRHRKIAEQLDQSQTKGTGFKLMIQKEGKLSNSPILLDIIGFEDCDEFDVWPFVGTLGASLTPINAQSCSTSRAKQSESVPVALLEERAM